MRRRCSHAKTQAAMRQLRNPFYVLLMIVGVLFTITMCAYAVMTIQLARGGETPGEGLIAFLAGQGHYLILGELSVLGAATVLAMTTDEYWTGGDEAGESGE
jgi:hypothetical protein